jgi:hypothetical protein
MSLRHPSRRRVLGVTALVGLLAAVALALVPTVVGGSSQNGLQASVVANTRGPLARNGTVWEFIYVSNGNEIVEATDGQFDSRDTLHNAFIVNSVEQHVIIDGDDTGTTTFTPPPNEFIRSWADHWPVTVKCAPDTSPCTIIGSTAVVPGEQAAVLFAGWGHGEGEPNGKYVFQYTVHGTLNGEPVAVTANSKPITMTD